MFGSSLAEDLYLSILGEGDSSPINEEILNSIVDHGLKLTTDFSPNFIESVKSFYNNGFESPSLHKLVHYMRKKNLLATPESEGSDEEDNEEEHFQEEQNELSNETL